MNEVGETGRIESSSSASRAAFFSLCPPNPTTNPNHLPTYLPFTTVAAISKSEQKKVSVISQYFSANFCMALRVRVGSWGAAAAAEPGAFGYVFVYFFGGMCV